MDKDKRVIAKRSIKIEQLMKCMRSDKEILMMSSLDKKVVKLNKQNDAN
jgi:hypothetical protein